MVTLQKITQENFFPVLKLDVHEGQKSFVASNVMSLAQAWLHPEIARPFAIYADESPVGFFMASVEEKPEGNEYGIWRLMIDKGQQGKGYGRAALRLAVDYLVGLGAKEISLSYEPENANAAALYASEGFVLTGEVDDGEVIAKLTAANHRRA